MKPTKTITVDVKESKEEKYHTVTETAKILTIHRNTMYQIINQRKIRVMKIGRRVVIPASCIEEFKNACLAESAYS